MRRIQFLLIILLSFTGATSFAQCKTQAKKCSEELKPFIFNGQLNRSIMAEGESAQLIMPFNGGTRYKVVVCPHKVLGDPHIRLIDQAGNVLYDNDDKREKNFFEFILASSQELIIDVSIPQEPGRENSELVMRGCVAILIGLENQDSSE